MLRESQDQSGNSSHAAELALAGAALLAAPDPTLITKVVGGIIVVSGGVVLLYENRDEIAAVGSTFFDGILNFAQRGRRNVADTGIMEEATRRAAEQGIGLEETLRVMRREARSANDTRRLRSIESTEKAIRKRNAQKRNR